MFTVCRVEVVLDTVVAAPRQLLCDFSPLVAHLLVQVKDDPLFIDTDRVLHNLRVQVVMPSITFRRGGSNSLFFSLSQLAKLDATYLSRHCLPVREPILYLSFRRLATKVHLFVPYSFTSYTMASSSYTTPQIVKVSVNHTKEFVIIDLPIFSKVSATPQTSFSGHT